MGEPVYVPLAPDDYVAPCPTSLIGLSMHTPCHSCGHTAGAHDTGHYCGICQATAKILVEMRRQRVELAAIVVTAMEFVAMKTANIEDSAEQTEATSRLLADLIEKVRRL